MNYFRQAWVEVDLDAIKHNIKAALNQNPDHEVMAVVKANAYGHGMIQVAKAALDAGAGVLAVSSLDEAIKLRLAHMTVPILVMGATRECDVARAVEYRITLTLHDEAIVDTVAKKSLPGQLDVHLKVDTGMNRLGLTTLNSVTSALSKLEGNPKVMVQGIYTHMATADETDETYLDEQITRFKAILDEIDVKQTYDVHLANSATLFKRQLTFTNAVRLGISMYGIDPSIGGIQLKPAMSLYARLTQVKFVKKGSKISYGATYVSAVDEWIGTVPIGYGDGFIRANQGRFVVVDGHECEIVGRVCMDQLMIRLPHEVEVGAVVELIGPNMPVVRVASELKTIEYEVLCLLSDRLPRVYKAGGEVVGEDLMRFGKGKRK